MDFILLIGQSNAKGCGNPEQSELPKNDVYEYVENFTGNACIPLGLTLQFSEGRGTIAPSLLNKWHDLTGNSVCIIHYAVDGSRIKNWNHDKFMYLQEAIKKFNNAIEYMSKKTVIGKKYALWIQGESDAKYGSSPIYYGERLQNIYDVLKKECKIDKMFLSLTGYWLGDKKNLKRCEAIAAMQEKICGQNEDLEIVSKQALSFVDRSLLQDEVHYSMKALNILGNEIAENMFKYYNNEKPEIKEFISLKKAREYIDKLELLEKEV